MKTFFRAVLVLAVMLPLTACITTKSYVDPQYRHASYESVHRLAQPVSVRVVAQFQRNGASTPAVNQQLQNQVEQTIRSTGAFVPGANAPATLLVTANNIADLAAARAKGFGTGLTFGAAGSTIDDSYEFDFAYQPSGGTKYETSYKHVIHTTVGHAVGPAGVVPTTPADAFDQVVRDVTLNFVKDLQDKGLLAQE